MEKRRRLKKEKRKPDTNPESPNDLPAKPTVPFIQDGGFSSLTHTEIYQVEIMNKHILAADLYEEQLTQRPKIAEKGLLAAMIERAILDLKQPDAMTRKYAEKWLFERPTMREFSVYWCLEWLDMLSGIDRLRVECRTLINNKTAQLCDAEAVVGKFLGNHRGNRAVEMMFRL